MLAGCLLAMVLPSLWIYALTQGYTEGEQPELGIVFSILMAFFIYTGLVAFAAYVTAYSMPQSDWFTTFFREKPQIPLFISIALIVVGMGNLLFTRPTLSKRNKIYYNDTQRFATLIPWQVMVLLVSVFIITFVPAVIVRFVKPGSVKGGFANEEPPRITLTQQNPGVVDPNDLVFMTFNVRQGFGLNGKNNFGRLKTLIAQSQAKIIGFQQADTCRITSGNTDLFEYLSHYLNFYEFYGPSPREMTTGVGILSAYPFQQTSYDLLPSEYGARGAYSHAYICVDAEQDKYIHFLSVHFGSYKTNITLQATAIATVINNLRRSQSFLDYSGLFLAGDLNTSLNSTAYSHLIQSTGMQNAIMQVRPTDLRVDIFKITTYMLYSIPPKQELKAYQLHKEHYHEVRFCNATVLDTNGISTSYPVQAVFK